METVVKVGRTVGGGVYRATGVVLRGARRILAAIPLLGIIADEPADESIDKKVITGGEEAENAAASPVEEKSVTSLNESAAGENEVKNEEKPAAAPEVTSSPAEEKQEAPSSPTAPIPVPVEDKKEEKTEKEVEKVEVSPTQAVAAPIEVMSQPQPIIAPSIIERKTSEDFPSLLPSSPPPTPINPSPLQQAQSAAANASALAEALKLPAEADLANACRLDYHKNDNEIVNSEPESMESNIEIDSKAIENKEEVEEAVQVESKAIETQDVQSIVEDVHRENIDTDIPIEEHSSLTDLSDNTKTCPIEVEEIAIETTAAVVDQQTCNNQFEKIDETSKTEEIITSEKSTEDDVKEIDDDNNTDVKMEIDTTIKTDNEDEEIPPPIPESPIPIPKASSQFINFITSQIEDSPPLSEPIETDNVMQPKLEVEDFSLQSTDNSIPSPPTETVVDTSIESQNPLSLQEINNLPPPPPEVAACEQVPDIVSSNPQETVEDIPTLSRSPSPEVSLGTVESSNELVEPEVNEDKKIEAFVEKNNHEFVKETIAAPVEEINTKSDLENRQSDTIEDKTASVDSLLNHQIQKNDQSIPETEAPVENSTLNSTTESTEETPKSPLASVQTEVTAPVAPAITEDVTSVTKAVEEIDINEKAVAAAVNENIESANKNEIIADMNYQNLNE
ncbi:fibrous sheath CABYR-binding protein-like isoform X2 [Chelonus insularis]|uniref:fibrous sheath CABYR-binding protein-like isoform X2 n=1 Tax=Chelonus insularis TaxID=460826 RepID=UPI00158DD14A|nr:fibrous sheath CABYR-binding protein-like isoform X2 [Chelonus insularis]XP_034948297.1 fibrous sheath CABYR-binding protein-like isoform X2 [Chelonus insularis]